MIHQKAVVPGLKHDVWYDPNAISNIVALNTIRQQYRVTYDSAQGSCFIVHRQEANGMPNMVFHMHPSGLHYYDPNATSNFTFLTTVKGIQAGLTQQQIQGAEKARDLYSKLAYPSMADYKWIVQSNSIQDCPVTLTDIKLAERIWGPNIAALKGKTTRSTPKPVTTDYLQVPPAILKLHKEVYLSADIFFVNQIPFFLTYSRNICFTTVTHLSDRKILNVFKAYQDVHQLYLRRGFLITTVAMDGEFGPVQALIQALPTGPRVNLTSAHEHVPDAERRIRTVKERVRSLCHSLPYTKLPSLMTTYMVLYCTKLLNYFPPKNSISGTISPRTLLTGSTLNFKKDFSLPFGAYCQVHEEAAPRNSMNARTKAAICLGPTQNLQGGYHFMALDTGRAITRYSWTQIPIPQLVIDKVDSWGANQPSLLTFFDRKGQPIGDSDQITGVYGDDPTTPVLDLTPIDIDIPPLHPLPVDEEAHLSDDDLEPITDSLTAPIPSTTPPVDEQTNIPMEYPTNEPTVEPTLDKTQLPPLAVPLDDVDPVDTVTPVETAEVRRSTRLRTAPRSYTPGFHGKTYTNHMQFLHPDTHLSLLTHETFATPTDPQVLATIMTQLSLKAGLKAWGDKASEAVHSEMKQLHFRDTFKPKHWKDLNETQRKSVLESHMFLKEKRDGKIKGRTVAGGNKQRDYISKEDASSPTVATEAVLLTCIIDAEEGRDVAVVDIPNAFIQTKIENESDMAIIKLRGILVDMLLDIAPNTYQPFVTTSKAAEKQLIVQCKNAIYGTMVASLLYYKKFSKSLISYGFEFNPYDPCVANKMIDGSQMTICFHVDDCKLSHVNPKVMDDMIAWLKQEYESIFEDGSGQMVVSRGKTHKYLGMTLDYTTTGQVKITMFDYVQEILTAFDEADPKATGLKTSAAPENLFKINENSPKLDPTMATAFHTLVAKTLYCTKRARPDTCTAIAFLTTRVREPDVEDWAKLSHLMKYLRGTKELPLILSANKSGVIKWYVDGSFAVHPNMKGHTGGGVTLGRGFPYVTSTKQKLNTRSSTESELVAVDDCMPAICWTRYFLESQGYGVFENILYQDNQSAILLEKNGKASSSKRTKHINVRYFFVTDRIISKELSVEWCPTGKMIADYMTKPVQGTLFKQFRDYIMGVNKSSLNNVMIPPVLGSQECVGDFSDDFGND
jgi:Reverse transcriptase (RNA-dependent DNA polymerase)